MFFVSIKVTDQEPIIAVRGYKEREDARIAAAVAKDTFRKFMRKDDFQKVEFGLVER